MYTMMKPTAEGTADNIASSGHVYSIMMNAPMMEMVATTRCVILSLQLFPTVSASLETRLMMSPLVLLSKYDMCIEFSLSERSLRIFLATYSEDAPIM